MTRNKKLLLISGMLLCLALLAAPLAARAYSHWTTIRVLWRVHDEIMLPRAEGRRYIQLFWQVNDELSSMIIADEKLRDESFEVVDRYLPYLEALVNGHGSQITLTQEDVQAVESILLLYAEKGSPALRSAITEELLLKDISAMVGMDMEQATDYILAPTEGRGPIFSYRYVEIHCPEGCGQEGSWPDLRIGEAQFWRGIPKDGTSTVMTFPLTLSEFEELPEGAPIWTVEAEPRYFGQLDRALLDGSILRLEEQIPPEPTMLPTEPPPTMLPTLPPPTTLPATSSP